MRFILSFVCLIIFSCCSKINTIDTSSLDFQTKYIDSLNTIFTNEYSEITNRIYEISDDDIIHKLVSKTKNKFDTTQFYQKLEFSIKLLDKRQYIIQQEIFFAKDQLNELKQDIKQHKISLTQYESQIDLQEQMIETLKERIDSSIFFFNKISGSIENSIQQNEP